MTPRVIKTGLERVIVELVTLRGAVTETPEMDVHGELARILGTVLETLQQDALEEVNQQIRERYKAVTGCTLTENTLGVLTVEGVSKDFSADKAVYDELVSEQQSRTWVEAESLQELLARDRAGG